MNHFLKYWYRGFDSALDRLDEQGRETLLCECGKACSNSYTRQVFIDTYAQAYGIDDFFKRLALRFSEMEIITVKKNRGYQVIYRSCPCDLIKNNFIKNPLFCECSKQSLMYNIESAMGKDKASVEMEQTLLGGADFCVFDIKLK